MTRYPTPRPLRRSVGRAAAALATIGLVATACSTTASPRSSGSAVSGSPAATGSLTKNWTQGITANQVRIGFSYNAFGPGNATAAPGHSTNPAVTGVTALVDYLNANGGIAGRQIVPVWHRYQLDSSTPDTEDQALCTDFTQDRPVFISTAGNTKLTEQCFADAGIPQVVIAADASQSTFDDDPYLVSTPQLNLTRTVDAEVQVLSSRGTLTPRAKIGLLAFDSPENNAAVQDGLKPALDEHGMSLAKEVYITKPTTPSEVADTLAQVSNSVLKFRSAGVDWVIFLGASPQFMIDAEKQQYRPNYVLSTWDYPADLVSNGVPKAQLAQIVGIGWSPLIDVSHQTGAAAPGQVKCLDIMSGQHVTAKSADDQATLVRICDQLFLIKQAMESAAKPISGDTVTTALEQLGTTFQPASTWQVDYREGQRDGVSAVRYLHYVSGCACFEYDGNLQQLADQ